MSKLSDALAALDKMTPGPWEAIKPFNSNGFWYINNHSTSSGEIATNYGVKAMYNANIIAAAPDALAWIKEALPLMEKLIEPIDEYLGTVAGGDVNYFHEQLDLYEKTKALIARAKPEV